MKKYKVLWIEDEKNWAESIYNSVTNSNYEMLPLPPEDFFSNDDDKRNRNNERWPTINYFSSQLSLSFTQITNLYKNVLSRNLFLPTTNPEERTEVNPIKFVKELILNNYEDLRAIICDLKLCESNTEGGNDYIKMIRGFAKDEDVKEKKLEWFFEYVPIIVYTQLTPNLAGNDYRVQAIETGANYFCQKSSQGRTGNADKVLLQYVNRSVDTFNYMYNLKDAGKQKSKKVFIVHGHDENLRNQVELLLSTLGLTPIILSKEDSNSQTIIEKLEKYMEDICFGIVLYTPCDIGGVKNAASEQELNSRARQNVVFEHGMLISKIGRSRVVALKKGEVEMPGDYSGVIFIKVVDDNNEWKFQLASQMRNVGIEADSNKIK